MRNVLVFTLLVLLASGLAAADSTIAALPAGKVKADVMQPAPSARATELTEKVKAALQSNAELSQSDAQRTNAEERVAFDERFGITRDESMELQRLTGDVHLAKAAEAEIEFVRSADGRVMVRADSSLSELTGIVMDPQNDFVDTPFGRATEHADVIAGEDQRTLGSWSGDQWKLEAPGDTFGTGTSITFAIGRLLDDGRGVLMYEAKKIEAGQVPRRASYVLVFPLARR